VELLRQSVAGIRSILENHVFFAKKHGYPNPGSTTESCLTRCSLHIHEEMLSP
jgi:hypothetical protein